MEDSRLVMGGILVTTTEVDTGSVLIGIPEFRLMDRPYRLMSGHTFNMSDKDL
jgi:hypothetical protein